MGHIPRGSAQKLPTSAAAVVPFGGVLDRQPHPRSALKALDHGLSVEQQYFELHGRQQGCEGLRASLQQSAAFGSSEPGSRSVGLPRERGLCGRHRQVHRSARPHLTRRSRRIEAMGLDPGGERALVCFGTLTKSWTDSRSGRIRQLAMACVGVGQTQEGSAASGGVGACSGCGGLWRRSAGRGLRRRA